MFPRSQGFSGASGSEAELPPPKKSLSQNFCHQQALLARISSSLNVDPEGQIWEIGPGRGALTRHVCGKASLVRLFEIDERLRPFLEGTFGHQATLHWGDFLGMDLLAIWQDGPQPGFICGNLPYHCGTAMVRQVLRLEPPPRRLIFLLQEEVARKAAAGPGNSEYGYLSIEIQWWARATVLETVAPGAFWPPPAVQSAVLCLEPQVLDPEARCLRLAGLPIVARAFQQRRKKALTTLQRAFPEWHTWWPEQFEALGIDRDARPERISPADWLRLVPAKSGG